MHVPLPPLSLFRRCWSLLLLAALLPSAASAQWTSNRSYQLLQRVDDVLFGIDNLGLVILDRRHVSGRLLRINASQPDPVRGNTPFVADCGPPLRFALVPDTVRGRPDPAALEFQEVKVLDGSWAAAKFACESTQQPARAALVARALYERGGPADTQTLYCDLQPDGSDDVRRGVEVRYSEEANAVAVNHQWLSSGKVGPELVEFGVNSKWRIQRGSLEVQRVTASGETAFSARCDKRPGAAPAAGSNLSLPSR